MKRLKYEILFTILFMTIGIAVVSSNLSINGSTPIANNPSDFNIYFSNVEDINSSTEKEIIVKSDKKFTINAQFHNLGDKLNVGFDITNSSKLYDAEISLTCTDSTEYLNIGYELSDNIVEATKTISGNIYANLIKSYIGNEDYQQSINCTINANAIERTSIGTSMPSEPLKRTYFVGEEITIGTEKFNVIKDNGNTITMLSKYNLSDNDTYLQTETQVWEFFSTEGGWEYTPGPKEINIQNYAGGAKESLNDYTLYLKNQHNINATGNLISVSELEELGCTIKKDYSAGEEYNCQNTNYDWLVNGQQWWTRSAYSSYENVIWTVTDTGLFKAFLIGAQYGGIRPTITISKSSIPIEIITFTIDDATYQAEKGMTWEAWLNSNYNYQSFHYYEFTKENKWICTGSSCSLYHIEITSPYNIIEADLNYISNSDIAF